MTSRAHRFGWREDPIKVEYEPVHRFMAKRHAAVDPLPTCSLLQFRSARLYQGGVGSCVSFGASRMFQLWASARGNPNPPRMSERVLYWVSRILEFEGMNPEQARGMVADTGAYPYLAFRGFSEVGLVPFELCPYPEGNDAWDATRIREVVYEQPPASVFAACYDQRGLETARVYEAGLERVQRVAELLQARMPVGFGMRVDSAFMSNSGGVVSSIDRYSVRGGHWMDVLAVLNSNGEPIKRPEHATSSSLILVDNWWDGWGRADGTGLISAGLFGSTWISDVTAAEFVPLPEAI